MDYEYMTLYENAMALFRKAGFTASYNPLTADHSFKQAVYLDSGKTVYVDKGLLNSAFEVSHLLIWTMSILTRDRVVLTSIRFD